MRISGTFNYKDKLTHQRLQLFQEVWETLERRNRTDVLRGGMEGAIVAFDIDPLPTALFPKSFRGWHVARLA